MSLLPKQSGGFVFKDPVVQWHRSHLWGTFQAATCKGTATADRSTATVSLQRFIVVIHNAVCLQ